jgi:hypothetical protein
MLDNLLNMNNVRHRITSSHVMTSIDVHCSHSSISIGLFSFIENLAMKCFIGRLSRLVIRFYCFFVLFSSFIDLLFIVNKNDSSYPTVTFRFAGCVLTGAKATRGNLFYCSSQLFIKIDLLVVFLVRMN